MRSRGVLGVIFAVALVAAAVAASGCGSSKPSYCSATSDLKSDVSKIGDDLTSANFSAVQTDVDSIQAQAQTVVDDAKSDFPSQTDQVNSSVNSLVDSVKSLGNSPTAQQLLTLGTQAAAAVKAVDALNSAIQDKC
jgi:hypothetical protein